MIIAVVAIALYVVLLVALVRFSLYPFRTPVFFSAGAMGLSQTDVSIATFDGLKLSAWWVPSVVPNSKKTVICCHGYMMNRSELSPVAFLLAKRGYNCLLIDFPAHGWSPKRKCGLGWTERHDVLAAIDYVKETVPGGEIVLYGSSMGAAAASFAMGVRPDGVRALVLDSAYDCLNDAILGWWHFLGGKWLKAALWPTLPISALVLGVNPNHVSVSKSLAMAQLPTLIIHGERDRLAEPQDARNNATALGDLAQIAWMPKSNHSEGRWLYPDLYYEALFGFLDSLEPTKPNS
ncbi:MAG: alpha/beta fold hydrolase [Fimbriimonadaceae bacterium]